jgi:hypothetical protein
MTNFGNGESPMKQSVKEQWLADLRSGEFRQGRRTLKANYPGYCVHCCLGVLAERQGKMGSPDIYREVERLILNGAEYLGLAKEGPLKTLIDMNDTKKMSFAEIADYIEANL